MCSFDCECQEHYWDVAGVWRRSRSTDVILRCRPSVARRKQIFPYFPPFCTIALVYHQQQTAVHLRCWNWFSRLFTKNISDGRHNVSSDILASNFYFSFTFIFSSKWHLYKPRCAFVSISMEVALEICMKREHKYKLFLCSLFLSPGH